MNVSAHIATPPQSTEVPTNGSTEPRIAITVRPSASPIINHTSQPVPTRQEVQDPNALRRKPNPSPHSLTERPQKPQSPLIPRLALVILIPVVMMVLMKVLGGGRSTKGRGAVEEVMLRQMMVMVHEQQGQGGNMEKMEALVRMVKMTDPKAAEAVEKVFMDNHRVEGSPREVVKEAEVVRPKAEL